MQVCKLRKEFHRRSKAEEAPEQRSREPQIQG